METFHLEREREGNFCGAFFQNEQEKVKLSSILNGVSDIHQCYEMLFITSFTNYHYLTSKFIVVFTAHNALVKI